MTSVVHTIPPGVLADSECPTEQGTAPHPSIFHKLWSKRRNSHGHLSSPFDRQPSMSNTPSNRSKLSVVTPHPIALSPISGGLEPVSDAAISEEFEELHEAIVLHVKQFYTSRNSLYKQDESALKYCIEHATTGLSVPWRKIQRLLDDNELRPGALSLCIAWTILSRSLLLKLGMSNSPGSTFLPPEVVECFQSFSIGAKEIDDATAEHDKTHVNFALLSRWKQICASLMHTTYVKNAFSHFDSRTVNIERALNDLDALLRCYAVSDEATRNYARLTDLREVLRKGSRFAFTLLEQPSFWKFDWTNGPMRSGSLVSERSQKLGDKGRTHWNGQGQHAGQGFDMVIWPSLIREMDGEGRKVEGETLGRKKFLFDFE